METLNYGVEIEMTGITKQQASNIIADYFNTGFGIYEGGTYSAWIAKDRKGRIWKAEHDSSIMAQRKVDGQKVTAGDDYKTEMVTPILQYDDLVDLQEIVRSLRKAGAMVNDHCGMHVHVGAENFTPQTLRNIVNIIASKEDLLYQALQVDPTRIRYCKKTNEMLLRTINRRKPKTMQQLADIWYQEDPYGRDRHYNETRYHGLNLHATFTKGTVEFRLFNSTLHAGEVKAYVQFCLAVCHQALIQKKASCKKSQMENEKYAFRCWMLRLGLIGDEFKTCRHHFLKNLSGNSAWREGHPEGAKNE